MSGTNERGPVSVRLPGKVHKDEYEPAGGSYIVSTLNFPQGASLCVSPSTHVNLVDQGLAHGEWGPIVPAFRKMFPIARKFDLEFQRMPAEQGEGLMFRAPQPLATVWVDGRIWRLKKVYAVAYLLTVARDPETARDMADRIQASLVEKSAPEFPPDRPASGLKPTIPEDWELLSESRRKKYWVSPDGHAFIIVWNRSPAPFWNAVANHGTSSGMARDALLVHETFSKRKAEVAKTEFVFDRRLWVLLSRARGTVKYKAGEYMVEMDRWVDPRTQGFQRVYIGGLTKEDFEAARKIRDSMVFVWK